MQHPPSPVAAPPRLDTPARSSVPRAGLRRRFGRVRTHAGGYLASWAWALPPVGIALGVRLAIFVAVDVVVRLLGAGLGPHPLKLAPYAGALENWHRYDGSWYLTIIQRGYHYPASPFSNVNFFPLFPSAAWLLSRMLAPLAGDEAALAAALGVSWVSFAGATVLIYRLALDRFDRSTAYGAVALLAAFPFGFYFGAPYTESLYLLLAVATFFCIERQRWWLAGIAAGLASATRPPGLFLGACVALAYLLDWRRSRRSWRANVLSLALTPLGAIAYALYCWASFGDPLAYVKASQGGWGGAHLQLDTLLFGLGLLLRPQDWLTGTDFGNIIYALYMLLFVAFAVSLVPISRRLGAPYALYAAATFLVPVLTFPTLTSTGRYLSVVFPTFMVLARGLRSRPGLREALVLCSGLFLAVFALLFALDVPLF